MFNDNPTVKERWLALGAFGGIAVFAVAAVLTPPDVLSQVGLAIPMLALYEASIWIVRAIERARGRALVAEENAANEGG